MSGKTLTIAKPNRKKKGKTLRSPRPTTHRQTKAEREATMEEIERFFEEHGIREKMRDSPPPSPQVSKNKGSTKGSSKGQKGGMKGRTRKLKRI